MLHARKTFKSLLAAGAAALFVLSLNAPLDASISPEVMAAAKKEGVVVWYTSTDTKALAAMVAKFDATHPGITLQTLQLSSNLIPARILTEQRGGHYNADVTNGDNIPMGQLKAAGALQPYKAPDPGKWVKGALDPSGYLHTGYMATTVLAWNPKKLAADGLKPPTSLADLAKPEWSGKIGIDSTAYNWYQGVLETMPNAQEFLKAVVANKPFITQGHTNTVTQLEAGEFDVTPTAYGYLADEDHAAGRNVDFLIPKPMFVDLGPLCMVNHAPHPNAAHVLLDWLLSKEGQQAFVDVSGRPSMRTDVKNRPRVYNPGMLIHIVSTPDPAKYNALVADYKALLGVN